MASTTTETPIRVTRTVYRYIAPGCVAVPTTSADALDSAAAPITATTMTRTPSSVAVPTTQGRVLVYVRHPGHTLPVTTASYQLATPPGTSTPSQPCAISPAATPPPTQCRPLATTPPKVVRQASGPLATTPSKVVREASEERPVSNGARKFPGGEQESDLLERLPVGVHADVLMGSGTDHVQLVSLGCMCAPKLSFQQLGRGSETLPFDWMRSRMEGILHFMRSDFQGFYEYATVKVGCGRTEESPGMTMFRSKYHSFWHDNPDDEGMREKYTRRIERFKGIDAREKPVLFVRAANSTDELCLAGELAAELAQRFGPQARLLLIVDFQHIVHGPVTVEELPENLLIYYHKKEDREPAFAPYMKPVKEGLLWAAGSQAQSTQFARLTDLVKMTTPEDWGYRAHGDVDAFEPLPEADCNRQKMKAMFASAGSA